MYKKNSSYSNFGAKLIKILEISTFFRDFFYLFFSSIDLPYYLVIVAK
jgi:hypothetical protein